MRVFSFPSYRSKPLFLLFAVILTGGLWFFGCAPLRLPEEEEAVLAPSLEAAPTAPALTESQLLGLKRPLNLIQDPDSEKYAMREVMEAYWALKEKAEQEGWRLILVSGYRSFWNQKAIWNDYMDTYFPPEEFTSKERVLKTMSSVSIPGFTRHHWGTDLDISGEALGGRLVNVKPDTPKTILKFYSWMEKNAPAFGFCRAYRGKRGVVKDEPWHWSYTGFAKDYQERFFQIQGHSRIFKKQVNEIIYIQENFSKIQKVMEGAVEPECMR